MGDRTLSERLAELEYSMKLLMERFDILEKKRDGTRVLIDELRKKKVGRPRGRKGNK